MSIKVKYIIPEDGDEYDHPNIMKITPSNKSSPTLADFKRHFSVPGEYHFRFLSIIGESRVWKDIISDNEVLPTFEGQIFTKATRIRSSKPTSNVYQEPQSQATASQPSITSKKPIEKPVSLIDDDSDDNIDFLTKHIHQNTTNTSVASDLLDVDAASYTTSKSNSNIDLFGLDTLQPTSARLSMQNSNSQRNMPTIQLNKGDILNSNANLSSYSSGGSNSGFNNTNTAGSGKSGYNTNMSANSQSSSTNQQPLRGTTVKPAGNKSVDAFSGLGDTLKMQPKK
jgi:hypothetical protein